MAQYYAAAGGSDVAAAYAAQAMVRRLLFLVLSHFDFDLQLKER
jgi:hypothetical protein